MDFDDPAFQGIVAGLAVVLVASLLALAPVIVLRYFKRKYRVGEEEAFALMVNAERSFFAWAVTETILLVAHFWFVDWDPKRIVLFPTLFFVGLWLFHGYHHVWKRRISRPHDDLALRQARKSFAPLRLGR